MARTEQQIAVQIYESMVTTDLGKLRRVEQDIREHDDTAKWLGSEDGANLRIFVRLRALKIERNRLLDDVEAGLLRLVEARELDKRGA